MSMAMAAGAIPVEQKVRVEPLREHIAALVVRRQELRGSRASRESLEQNRLELGRSQRELGYALIARHRCGRASCTGSPSPHVKKASGGRC